MSEKPRVGVACNSAVSDVAVTNVKHVKNSKHAGLKRNTEVEKGSDTGAEALKAETAQFLKERPS